MSIHSTDSMMENETGKVEIRLIESNAKMKLNVTYSVFLALSICVMFSGICVFIQTDGVKPLIDFQRVPGIFVVAYGLVLMAIAFLGFYGLKREKDSIFFVVTSASLFYVLLCICGAIVGFSYYYNGYNGPSNFNKFKMAVENYKQDESATQFVDKVQKWMKCCGIGDTGYLEWRQNKFYKCTQHNYNYERCGIPHSCCKQKVVPINFTCGARLNNDTFREDDVLKRINTMGCIEKAKQKINAICLWLPLAALALTIPMILGVYFTVKVGLDMQFNERNLHNTGRRNARWNYSWVESRTLVETTNL